MSNLLKVWMPDGPLSAPQRRLLSVTASSKPQRSLYLSLLEQKLDALVKENQTAARQALELSQEQAPELWSIAEQSPPAQWAPQLVRSEGMQRLLAEVKWDSPGSLQSVQKQSLLEIVEQLA